MPQPRHGEIVGGRRAADRLRLHVQETDGDVFGHPPRQPRAAQDGNRLSGGADADAPAEEEVRLAGVVERRPAAVGHREGPGVLEEEGSLLGEEELEPIEVDLLVVHLDLREVGVVGQVEGQSRRDAVLQVAAESAQRERAAVRPVDAIDRFADDVGGHLQRAPEPLGRPDASQLSGERDAEQVVLPRQRRPVRLLVAPADVALKVDAPGLLAAGREAQRAERDGELRRPAHVGDGGAHLPHAVPVLVEAAAGAADLTAGAEPPHAAAARPLVDELPVVLLAGRAGAEDKAVLPVEKGIQNELEAVAVGERRVAAAVGDDDRCRIAVVADDTEVDGVRGVDDPHLGPFGSRPALFRLRLHEPGGRRGVGPGGIVEHGPIEDRGHGRLDRGYGTETADRGDLEAGRRLRRRPGQWRGHLFRGRLPRPHRRHGEGREDGHNTTGCLPASALIRRTACHEHQRAEAGS